MTRAAGVKTDVPAQSRHRVVIVGCGFGGLFAARALRRADVDVTVIDRNNHHLFQPLLYQMATGILAEGDIAPPIRDILRHQRNATVLLGDVRRIDLQRRHVTVDTLGQHSDVPYAFTRRPDGTTDIDAVVVRDGKNLKGRALGLVLGTVGKRVLKTAFENTVRAIEARNRDSVEGSMQTRARRTL